LELSQRHISVLGRRVARADLGNCPTPQKNHRFLILYDIELRKFSADHTGLKSKKKCNGPLFGKGSPKFFEYVSFESWYK